MAKVLDAKANLEDEILEEGTFDLLLMLYEGPKSFIGLKNVGHSPNTVLTRLRRLQNARLVENKLFEVKKGRKQRIKYVLTAEGEKLTKRYMPIRADYKELKRTIDDLESKISQQKQSIKLLLASVKKPLPHK